MEQNLVFGDTIFSALKHRKFLYFMNLTVVHISTILILFISNLIDNIWKIVTKKEIKIIQFFVSPVNFQKVKLRGFVTSTPLQYSA